MRYKSVSPSRFPRIAAWTRALRTWLRSLTRVDESGLAADRLPRAEDIEFKKYAP
ncbi:MAG: hypothetical protein ABSC22_05010 [Roseiarcus sp.]|jgi:hypothetical protein